MAAILYPIFTIAQLLLFFRLWKLRRGSGKRVAGVLILQVVLFSLIYDNLIISVGGLLGEGDLLERLNLGRFVLRAVFTPLLMVTVVEFAARGSVKWAKNIISRIIIGFAMVSLMGLGIFLNVFASSELVPETFAGTLRYIHILDAPPIPSTLTILAVIIFGALIWRAVKWPWVFVGGLITFIGSAVPVTLVGPVVNSGVEVLLMWSLVATKNRFAAPDYSLSESELDSRISRVSAGRSKKSS